MAPFSRILQFVVATPVTAARWDGSVVVRAGLLAVWVGLCDAWLKAMARAAGCSEPPDIGSLVAHPWALPEQCPGAALVGESIRLAPAVRDGGPFGIAGGMLTGPTGGLVLLAIAAVVTIAVVLWRWRDRGDALALGVLWGGAASLALPMLVGPGHGLADLTVGGLALALGDLAMLWALAWLVWRAIAEYRA